MAKLKLSKSSLAEQRAQLQLYQRLLPSLELKRRQVSVELEKARAEHTELTAAVDEMETGIGAALPMLAQRDVDLVGLVRLTGVELGEENVVGVKLPLLSRTVCKVADYSRLAQPAWVDVLVERLQEAAALRIGLQIAEQRVRLLQRAVRRVTQRVNLFDRILIPTAKRNIERIRIFLGDLERDAVVRSKLAKSRRQALAPLE